MKEKIKELTNVIINNNPFKVIEEFYKDIQGKNYILKYLYEKKEDASAGELSTIMKVSTARVAALIKKLEKNNYIEKYNPSYDARITMVHLTKTGHDFIEKKLETIFDKVEKIIDAFGENKVDDFIYMAKELNKIFNK